MKKNVGWILMLVILGVAAYLRFTPALFDRDYWYDEAFTGILLKQPWDAMNQMIFADVHPPLYYWLAKIWAAPFGYSPEGIRTFSLAMGLMTVISIFWVGAKMFNWRAGIIAAALTAISPFAIEYSQEARMYSLFGFLMLWATWFFYQALETGRVKYWLAWGIFGGLSFYTHYLSLFFFVLFYLSFLVYQIQSGNLPKEGSFFRRNFQLVLANKKFWLGVGIIVLFFVSWIKVFLVHISKGNLGWIEPSQFSDIPKTLQIFFFGHPAGTGGVPWANPFRYFFDGTSAGVVIFALLIAMLVYCLTKRIKVKEFTLLSVISFGTLVFLIILSHGIDREINGEIKNISIKLYVARYFMPAALLVYLLFAGLISESIGKRWGWLPVIGVYGLLLLMLKPLDFNSGWDQVYEKKAELLRGGAIVIASNPFDYSTARYYFGQERVRYYNKNNPTEDFSGWVVVGNQNRINSIEELEQYQDAIIVDGSCDWNGVALQEEMRLDNVSVCRMP